MPRPGKPSSIGAQEATEDRITQWLRDNDRSVGWMERKVRENGYHLPPNSLRRSLSDGRTIRVDEAIAIADVMGVSIVDLVQPTAASRARAAEKVAAFARDAAAMMGRPQAAEDESGPGETVAEVGGRERGML